MRDKLHRATAAAPLRVYKSGVLSPVEAQGGRLGDDRIDLPQGTLDLLILKALSLGPQHGWAVSERVHDVSRGTLQIPEGSLYPALHPLERKGWISATWGASDNNRRAKYYELTRAGRRQRDAETEAWEKLITAVGLVLRMACCYPTCVFDCARSLVAAPWNASWMPSCAFISSAKRTNSYAPALPAKKPSGAHGLRSAAWIASRTTPVTRAVSSWSTAW